MPLGYVALQGNPHLPPTYPVGLPLHLALARLFLSWTASAILVQLLTGLGALWLCYAVARELGVEPWLAAAGAVVLAAFPVFIFISIQTLSDTPATTWCLFAVWLALRARRGHWGWAVGCGAAFAMAVFVRATNAVLLPALLVFLGGNWKRIGLGLLGGLPGALWLAYYNHTLYGSALASGYGPIQETFKLEYGPRTIKHFLYWFAVAAPAVLLALPFAARWRIRTRDLIGLVLWFGIITGVYVFYQVSYETWWCLRFILPAFPALIILSLLGLERLRPRHRPLAGAVLAAWACACSIFWIPRLHALYSYEHEQPYAAASIRAREIFPADSLVVCFYTSGAVFFYTPFSVLRWDLIDQKDFARYVELARAAGRPVRAMLFDEFEDDAFKERVPGEWKRLDTVGKIGLWELIAARPAPPEPAR
jgi:4-amino-4-deoxy-L-arabinose transferase-like glycosyltransferase